MDLSINKEPFWSYLSQSQQDLISEGLYLVEFVKSAPPEKFKDYSFLVFSFAKALEGFLKQVYLDADMISRLDYISDHLRLGKLLSPNLTEKLGERSLYSKLINKTDENFANKVWQVWKVGRNQIFHYFSHNIKAVTFEEAVGLIDSIIDLMRESYMRLLPPEKQKISE